MVDRSELKRLALRVIEIESTESEPIHEAWDEFEANANPAVVLALIAENERLESEAVYSAAGFDAARDEIARLKAENAGIKTGYEAYEQVNAGLKAEVARSTEREILQLAEIESLRKDAERYRWLRIADWWRSSVCVIRNPKEQAKLGSDCPSGDRLDAAIDAAVGKGEQS